MTDALAAGDRVELREFGAFSARQMKARTSRNPRSDDRVQVAAKAAVHFKMAKTMRARLNHQRIEPEDEARRLLHASSSWPTVAGSPIPR